MDSLHRTYTAARRALDAGTLDHAAEQLDRMLLQFPHFVDAHQLLGELYLQSRRYQDAIVTFQHVLNVDPEHVDALYGVGAAQHYLGIEAGAQAAWERALDIRPTLADERALVRQLFPQLRAQRTEQHNQAGLARLYLRSGMLDRAIKVLHAQVRAHEQRTDLHVALAEALWRANRFAEAQRVCYDLLALKPQLVKPTLLLAYMLIEEHEPGGTALWQRAAAQDPLQTMARTLFATLPNVPAPAPQALPAEAGAAPQDGQTIMPDDNDELLRQLILDVPDDTGTAPADPDPAPSALTVDEVMMAQGTPESTDEPRSDDESDNAGPHVAAAVNTPEKHEPAVTFDTLLAQADAEPANHVLRLAVARIGWQIDPQRSLSIYKQLIKQDALLENIADDLHEQIKTVDPRLQHTIYRLLGDVYMRQHRVADATQAYQYAFAERSRAQPAG